MSDSRPLPILDAGGAGPDIFWSYAKNRQLVFQRCTVCSCIAAYPRGHCPDCGSPDVGMVVSAGFGTVYSLTVVRVHPEPFFAARCPFALGIVDLDEGSRMVAEFRGDPEAVRIGARVSLEWDVIGDLPVPVFVPVDAAMTPSAESTTVGRSGD